MKHGERFGLPMLPIGVDRVWAGLGTIKANRGKEFGCFILPKIGPEGLEAYQSVPRQLLVVEVFWEKVTQRFYAM